MMSESGSELHRSLHEEELKQWIVHRSYSSTQLRKERYREIVSANSRALQEPKDVFDYLQSRYELWVKEQEKRDIYYPQFEEYNTEDREFLSKNHPLINLALAQFSTSAFVLETLFQTGKEAIRCATLSHWAPLGWLRNHSRSLRENEIEALLMNPYLEAQPYLEFCLEKAGPFSSLSDIKWIKCIIIASSNPCFSEEGRRKYRGGEDEEFAGYYSYLSLVDLFWGLAKQVDTNINWARCLALSLKDCVLPHKSNPEILELIKRWETPTEFASKSLAEERHVFEQVRVNLARRIVPDTTFFQDLQHSEDIALRASYYLRFKPLSVKEIEHYALKDGKVFVRAALNNKDIVKNKIFIQKLLELAVEIGDEQKELVEKKIQQIEEEHIRRLLASEQAVLGNLDDSASQLLQCIHAIRDVFGKPDEGSCHLYSLFLDLTERLEAHAQETNEPSHVFSKKLNYLRDFLESLYYALSKEARALRDFQQLMLPQVDDASQRSLWERGNAEEAFREGWTAKTFREVDMPSLVNLVESYLDRSWLRHTLIDAILLDALLANQALHAGESFKRGLGSRNKKKAQKLYDKVDGNLDKLVGLIRLRKLLSPLSILLLFVCGSFSFAWFQGYITEDVALFLPALAFLLFVVYFFNPIGDLDVEGVKHLKKLQKVYDSLNTPYINPHFLKLELFDLVKMGVSIHPLIFLMIERMQQKSCYAARYPLVPVAKPHVPNEQKD
jgi:hypothetical protein